MRDLFDHCTRSQLALVDVPSGKVTLLGQPGIYTSVEVAPGGKHLLVERLQRPYSYLRPYSRFPKAVEIWDTAGTVVEEAASIPLADRVPIDGVAPGPRGFARRTNWGASTGTASVWAATATGP